MRWSVNRMVLAGCAALLAAGPVRAAGPALPAVESRDFAATAARLAVGSRLRLENVQVANSGETRALVLERFEVFAQDATTPHLEIERVGVTLAIEVATPLRVTLAPTHAPRDLAARMDSPVDAHAATPDPGS